jgi:CHAT domain/NB-ARC domain/Tetratricopeptide repeat
MTTQPIALLTFAPNHLKNVLKESQYLTKIFAESTQIQSQIVPSLNETNLLNAVTQCGNQLRLLHFGGHANTEGLAFEDWVPLDAVRFTEILTNQNAPLDLVFLNACNTYGHAVPLLGSGTKAVLITNAKIDDAAAMRLAVKFYELFVLHNSTLYKAFKGSEAAYGKGAQSYVHTLYPWQLDGEPFQGDWMLVVNKNYAHVMDWTLADFINPPRNSKIPRLLTQNAGNPSYFLGRETDLEAIRTAFSDSLQPLFLVNGEGGIGKTTLAARYWHLQQKHYKYLGWLNAAFGVKEAILSLAIPFGIRFEPQDTQEIQIQKVVQQLRDLESPVLLVLDNADDSADLKAHFTVLQPFTNCHLLVTTRVHELADARVHRVEPFHEKEALELFAHHYKRLQGNELTLLKQIFEAVGYNTLVLELVAKNLNVLNRFRADAYPLAQLLKDLQTKGLLAIRNKTVDVLYQNPTLRNAKPEEIIRAMYDLHPLSAECVSLLSNFSVLPPVAIPFETFRDLLQLADEDAFEGNLADLRQRGWIQFKETEEGFKVSPVVQAVVRDKQQQQLFEDCAVLMKSLSEKLSIDQTKDNPVDKFQWVPFGRAFAQSFEEHTEPDFARLQNNLATVLYNLGDFVGAKALLEKAYFIYLNHLGAAHPHTQATKATLNYVIQALKQKKR